MKHLIVSIAPEDAVHNVRCHSCGALLYRTLGKAASVEERLEIKCRRCGTINRGEAWDNLIRR